MTTEEDNGDTAPSAAVSHTPPRSSKGWDGKLRVGKAAEEDEAAREGTTPPESEGEEDNVDEGPPPEQILADEDLLAEIDEKETDIDLNHCRISSIPALSLSRFPNLERLCLRQNQVASLHFPFNWGSTIKELDLYDNAISHIKGLDGFENLETLDLSFNNIKHIKRVGHLKKLKELFFVQNRIQKIEELDGLIELTNLELGGNRIREIENLDAVPNLTELYLGKNKITTLANLDPLKHLKLLSIQSNRITSASLAHLAVLPALTELYISHNLIDSLAPLAACTGLTTLDVSSNPVASLDGLGPLMALEELWASNCKLDSFEEVDEMLRDKPRLETVYFEGNPLQRRQPALYRNKVRLALPQVRQIDATFVRVD